MIPLLRSLLLACTAVVFAQNPLAISADAFSGTFQNEQLKLDLSRKGNEYNGVILLGGQSLPVKAHATAGKLTGTFESGGQAYSFQATRNGTKLTLTTDGVTHVLDKAVAAPPTATPVTSPVVGQWQTPNGIVAINADGSAKIGEKTHRWTVEGNVITFAGNGESLKVPFDLAGDNWTWKFPDGRLALTRIAANAAAQSGGDGVVGAWQGPTGNMQINLDGSATIGGVQYRYTQAANQLTLAGPDGMFVATVQIAGDNMTWLINGKTLSFQRAANVWAVGGAATGGILPELVGKWCQMSTLNNSTGVSSRSACFTLLADGSFQFAGESGATGQVNGGAYGTASDSNDSGTWTATADSITSTSKKTGVRTFRLEKRNHPKTGDPMLVLDGAEFTTAYQKAPWR
jgi:hypothetical protein